MNENNKGYNETVHKKVCEKDMETLRALACTLTFSNIVAKAWKHIVPWDMQSLKYDYSSSNMLPTAHDESV